MLRFKYKDIQIEKELCRTLKSTVQLGKWSPSLTSIRGTGFGVFRYKYVYGYCPHEIAVR